MKLQSLKGRSHLFTRKLNQRNNNQKLEDFLFLFQMEGPLENLHKSYNLVDVLDDRDYQRIYQHFHSLFGLAHDTDNCSILAIDLNLGKVHCKYRSVNFSVDINVHHE